MDTELIMVLGCVKGAVVCVVNGVRTEYASGQEAKQSITGKYLVDGIIAEKSKVVVSLVKDKRIPNDLNADWVKDHVEKYGKEPESF